MVKEFENYMTQMIELTCGFAPTLEVKQPYPGTIQVWIAGSPIERSLIMGKEAKNIQAFSRLAHIFARRNNFFCYLYVKPKEGTDHTLDRALNSII